MASGLTGFLLLGILPGACSSSHGRGDDSDAGSGQGAPTQLGGANGTVLSDGDAEGEPQRIEDPIRGGQDVTDSQVWVGELHDLYSGCDVDAFNSSETASLYVQGTTVVLSVDLGADGHVLAAGMTFGEGDPPTPPSDVPVTAWLRPCVTMPFVGFEYVGHDIEDDGERLTLGINALDVYGTWCAEQQPVEVDEVRAEASGLSYACRTYGEEHADYDPSLHHPHSSPRRHERTSLPDQLCFPWQDVTCRCSQDGCLITQHLRYIDLLRTGDLMDGVFLETGDLYLGTPRLLLQRVR